MNFSDIDLNFKMRNSAGFDRMGLRHESGKN